MFFDIINMYIYVRKAARKTRRIFEGLIGNDSLKKKLFSDLSSESLSHAYIIEGKRGSGRHTVAKMTAAALSCVNRENSSMPLPCGECLNCRKILADNSPDVITIGIEEKKASIGVEAARFLRSDIRVIPNDLDYKVYIIEDADTMTPQAQNALLLSLEEPPSFVKFFLLCEDAGAMLETIRSRAQILRTEPIEAADIDKYVVSHYPEALRMKQSDPKMFGELIMSAQNSIGEAISLLEPKNFKKLSDMRAVAREFTEAVVKGIDSEKAAILISKFEIKRDSLSLQLENVLLSLRDLIALSKSETAPLLFYYDRDEALALCDSVSIKMLVKAYDEVDKTLKVLSANANARLSLLKLFSDTGIL